MRHDGYVLQVGILFMEEHWTRKEKNVSFHWGVFGSWDSDLCLDIFALLYELFRLLRGLALECTRVL